MELERGVAWFAEIRPTRRCSYTNSATDCKPDSDPVHRAGCPGGERYTLPGQVTVQLRLYNGGGAPLPIAPDDVWLALGYAENPPGPLIPAEGMTPFDLLPQQAADMTLVWLWDEEPFARLGIGEYRFSIQFAFG